jgi:DNA-binding transcriptional MerR regulator
MKQEPKSMSVKEVCAALNISHDTLSRRTEQGLIAPLPRNPALSKAPLRFRPADVERLLIAPPVVRAPKPKE